MKSEIYNALAALNRSFDVVLESLTTLEQEGVVAAAYVQHQSECVEAFRAGINSLILNRLGTREVADREHFDKMRITTEARLKKP